MKSYLYLGTVLALAMCLLAAPDATAQKPNKKEEKRLKKEWKAKAKNYVKNPLTLKAYDENNTAQVEALRAENKALQEKLRQLQAEMDRQTAEIRRLQGENQELRTAYEAQKNANEKDLKPGLVFKVQIGAFEKFNINQYLQETENFEGESTDGLNKYTIGNFRDPNIADAFRQDIRKMGIRDAWIVPYRDGVRITMTEAKQLMESAGVKMEPK